MTRRLDAERSFLTMALDSPVGVATLDGLDASDPTFGAASVVLSWLVDHEIGGGSMAVLSPFLVVLTIWDAASSAGSGVAAPASGLGTFVLIVLLDRSRLASKADLAGRPDDD